MNRLRILSAGGILGIAGLLALPASSAHAAPQLPHGTASSSALQLKVSPQALLNISPELAGVLRTIPVVSDAVSAGGTLGLTIDGANAVGTLTNTLATAVDGHADSTPVSLDLSALQNLIGKLNLAIKNLTGVDLQGQLVSVLNTVNPSIGTAISKLNSDIPGALTGLLHDLAGADINTTISAPFGQSVSSNLLSIPNLPAGLGNLTLAPFHAHALTSGSGADNTTTNLAVLPALGSLSNVDIAGLLAELTNIRATLNTVVTTVNTGVPVATVQNLVAGTPLAGITNQALGVIQTTTNTLGQTVVSTAPLSQLQSQLDALIGSLSALKAFNSGLLGINGIVKTAGVTSTASLIPDAGGITAQATTKLAYVDVLPLPVAIPNLAAAGTSLIHLEAVTADSTSSLGTAKETVAHGGLGALSVLGHSISLDSLGLGQSLTQAIGPLTVVITRGVPVNTVTKDAAQSSMAVLEVQVLTNPLLSSNALAPLTSAFGARNAQAASTGAQQLVDLQVGSATTAVGTIVPTCLTNCGGNVPLPKTGMFGPLAAVGGAGLAGVAILMQFVPRIAARRRRDG